jgi:hypothetical protein
MQLRASGEPIERVHAPEPLERSMIKQRSQFSQRARPTRG